jgi:phosphohistidine phosphatase
MKGENAAMELYLLRHGAAEEASANTPDADRALTNDGRRKLRPVVEAAAAAGLEPSLILTSPLKRAVQTAEVARDVLKYKNDLLRTQALAPGATAQQVWDEVRAHRDQRSMLLVGHNPLFSELSGYLLGSDDVQVDFKKGAILRIDLEHFAAKPRGILRWYLTPKLATRD